MSKKKQTQEEQRMIHIRLSEQTHKQLRIKVAELDSSIQEWVAKLIEDNLKRKR